MSIADAMVVHLIRPDGHRACGSTRPDEISTDDLANVTCGMCFVLVPPAPLLRGDSPYMQSLRADLDGKPQPPDLWRDGVPPPWLPVRTSHRLIERIHRLRWRLAIWLIGYDPTEER